MRIACLLFALVLCTRMRVAAQAEEPLFHHISLEEGLSDGRISAITQDKYGFMWFGTGNGLNRYDGYNFKVYAEGESGLKGSNISALYRSKAGALWVGDGEGLRLYDYRDDRFVEPAGIDSSDINKKGYAVWLMKEDAAGRLYIGCREGLYRYNPATALTEDMNVVLGSRNRIRAVSGITLGEDGRLWITTQKLGFFYIDPARNTWGEVPSDRQYGHDTCCYAIHRTVFLDRDHLLIGQHSYGLTVLDTRTLKFTAQPGFMGRNDSVRFNAVYRLIKDSKGRIWGGTEYFGLIQYIPGSREVTQYKYDAFNPYSFGGHRVMALYEDRDHNIWVGTGGYGVYRFQPDKGAIRYYPWNPVSKRSPPGAEVISGARRDSVSMWVGTDKGPAIFNYRSGTFLPYRYENTYHSSLPGTFVSPIFTDSKGFVWMPSRALGIARYDPRTNTFLRIYRPEQGLIGQPAQLPKQTLPANTITRVAEEPGGGLLLLILRRITLFDPVTFKSRYWNGDTAHLLLRLKDVDDLLTVGRRLLIVTNSKAGSKVLAYSYDDGQLRTLAVIDSSGKTRIRGMEVAPDGTIVLATSDGIHLMDATGRMIRRYSWPGRDIGNSFRAVITGVPGYVWTCTDRRIGRVDLKTGQWLWPGSSEGLKPTRFFGEAFKLTGDGHIIAGSGDGLFLINPAAVQPPPKRPPVLVEFRVFGKALPLDAPLQETHTIRLSHEQNFFSFGMSTLDFGENSNTEYGYMLEGYDRDWQTAGSDRSGQYTGVPGGRYTLRLRARSGTADWVVSSQEVRILIDKPWWGTWLFRIVLALLLLGIVGMIYFYRVRTIRKAARLRTEYEIRLNELEMSALRTQMNPHFIFNCLNTINSYINSNQKTQANHYITRFAKLIRLILENSRQRRIALSKELEALHLYFQLESLRFENRFVYSIEVDDALDADNVEVPPLVLQPFVENAILHGILPRPGSGTISVRIRQKDSLVEYVVEDNGIGRAEAKKRSAEGALQKESHGMAITEKRIAMFNRENGATAEVKVDDLMEDGVAAGTRVCIPLALVEGF